MSKIEIAYSANDMYYENANFCSVDPKTGEATNKDGTTTAECSDNKTAFSDLAKSADSRSKSGEKYDNIKQLYNREIIYAFNLIFGICALLYYIYVNQDALPTMETIGNAVKTAASKVTESAKELSIPVAVPVTK